MTPGPHPESSNSKAPNTGTPRQQKPGFGGAPSHHLGHHSESAPQAPPPSSSSPFRQVQFQNHPDAPSSTFKPNGHESYGCNLNGNGNSKPSNLKPATTGRKVSIEDPSQPSNGIPIHKYNSSTAQQQQQHAPRPTTPQADAANNSKNTTSAANSTAQGHLGAFPHADCHVSVDPTRSVSVPQPSAFPLGLGPSPAAHTAHQFYHPQQQPGACFSQSLGASHLNPHFNPFNLAPGTNAAQPPSAFPPLTYLGPQQAPPAGTMADYQNAAPQPNGVNFQPPVPDTTYGPMQHLYVPRFDGGFVPGAQQHQPAFGGMAVGQQPGYVVAQQPQVYQQHMMGQQQQPYLMNGQPSWSQMPQSFAAAPQMGYAGGGGCGVGGPPVVTGNSGNAPDVSGIGRTPGEEQLRQVQFAYNNKLFEPQEFKPADDDPSRFYWCREKDGAWTQRNRYTIDNVGDHRWYVTDEGWFYAVRLND